MWIYLRYLSVIVSLNTTKITYSCAPQLLKSLVMPVAKSLVICSRFNALIISEWIQISCLLASKIITNNGRAIKSFKVLKMVDCKQTKMADGRWHWVTRDVEDDQTSQVLNTTTKSHLLLSLLFIILLFYFLFSWIQKKVKRLMTMLNLLQTWRHGIKD